MTNLPFGFNPGDGDDDRDRGSSGGSGGSGGFGFDPGSFDISQLGNMLSQLGKMMSEAGEQGDGGPISYDMAQKLALQAIPASHPASSVDVDKVREAVQLAEIWLDGVTGFPAATRTSTAWNPRQWVEQTMPTWKQLCDPIAERVSASWTDALPEEVRSQVGPLLGMLTSMGGMSFGTQLGQGLAQLSGEVLTSTDIGLPLGPEGTAALLPTAIAQFAQGLSVDDDQVRLYLAAREAAHHRLYAAAPWLREKVIGLVRAYASAISVDFSEMEDLAEKFDPSDPAKMQELLTGQGLGQGMFEPKITAGQESALQDLETLLALVEGWVDAVVSAAVGDRLPGAVALRETMRRRRASGGPSEQTFANLIGLQMRPVRLRAAAELWESVGESRGSDGRDALWAHQDLLPISRDLDDPTGFVQRDKEFTELLAGFDDFESLADLGFDADKKPADADQTDAEATDGTADTASSESSEDTGSSDGTDSADSAGSTEDTDGPDDAEGPTHL